MLDYSQYNRDQLRSMAVTKAETDGFMTSLVNQKGDKDKWTAYLQQGTWAESWGEQKEKKGKKTHPIQQPIEQETEKTTSTPDRLSRYEESPLTLSLITDHGDNKPKAWGTTWGEFVRSCQHPEARGKMLLDEYLECSGDPARVHLARDQKNGKGIVPGEFAVFGTRSKDHLKNRSLLVLDMDNGGMTFEQFVKALSGIECVVHTSYSHSDRKGKFRAFILLDKPVTGTPDEINGHCANMLDYFQSVLNDKIDPKCWTVSQLYYLPSCPPDAINLYQWQHIGGEPLRTADFRAYEPPPEKIRKATEQTGNLPGDIYNKDRQFRKLLEGEGWRFFFSGNQGDHYTRPGKQRGISATVFHDNNVVWIHSTAPEVFPFTGGTACSQFHAYALINHGGDHTAAAAQLAAEGYRDRNQQKDTGTSNTYEFTPGNDTGNYDSLFISAADLLLQVVEIRPLIGKIIEQGMTGQIFGPSGGGKSFIAMDMGMSVATGRTWNGNQCQQGHVLYFAGEGHNGLKRRVHAWHLHTGKPDISRFHISRKTVSFDAKGLAAVVTEVRQMEEATGERVALVIVDTLARHLQGDENTAKDMSTFIVMVDGLRNAFPDSSAMIVHHTGNSAEAANRARGSSALKAACDFEFNCDKGLLKFCKMKDSEEPADIEFKLIPLKIGMDDEGADITSCIVQYGERSVKDRKTTLTARERIGVESLIDVSARLFIIGSDGKQGALVGDWRKEFYARLQLMEGDKKPDALLKAFTRLYTGLLDVGIIVQDNNTFMLVSAEHQEKIQLKQLADKIRSKPDTGHKPDIYGHCPAPVKRTDTDTPL